MVELEVQSPPVKSQQFFGPHGHLTAWIRVALVLLHLGGLGVTCFPLTNHNKIRFKRLTLSGYLRAKATATAPAEACFTHC